jgi:single-stranded DNA-binding protein
MYAKTVITGYASNPQLEKTKNGKVYLRFGIGVNDPTSRDENTPKVYFNVKVWDTDKALRLYQKMGWGCTVNVEGWESINTYTNRSGELVVSRELNNPPVLQVVTYGNLDHENTTPLKERHERMTVLGINPTAPRDGYGELGNWTKDNMDDDYDAPYPDNVDDIPF